MIQPFVQHSVTAFVLFIVNSLFNYFSFRFLLFDYSVYFSILILELYSRYFDPLNNNHAAVDKHHTADNTIFVLVQEARAYYHHRHGWISGTNFSIWIKQTVRHFVLFDVRIVCCHFFLVRGYVFPNCILSFSVKYIDVCWLLFFRITSIWFY